MYASPEEYLRAPERYKDIFGDHCHPESFSPAILQKQLYLDNKSSRGMGLSPRELEKVLSARRRKLVETGHVVPERDPSVKAHSRLSQLLASCEMSSRVPPPTSMPTNRGNLTYRVQRPNTTGPHMVQTFVTPDKKSKPNSPTHDLRRVGHGTPSWSPDTHPVPHTLDPVKSKANHYPGNSRCLTASPNSSNPNLIRPPDTSRPTSLIDGNSLSSLRLTTDELRKTISTAMSDAESPKRTIHTAAQSRSRKYPLVGTEPSDSWSRP